MPRRSHLGIVSVSALALAACASSPAPETASAPPAEANWRSVATAADRDRLRNWRQAWVSALGQASPSDRTKIAAEGALLRPDAALDDAQPPAGSYRCRVLKLGSQANAGRAFTAYPAFECRIADEGALMGFHKVGGSQRPQGLVFPTPDGRQIFLGTMMLGDETRAVEYGEDATRDMAGAIERVGPMRWRLVLPYPKFESVIDVIELVPASG